MHINLNILQVSDKLKLAAKITALHSLEFNKDSSLSNEVVMDEMNRTFVVLIARISNTLIPTSTVRRYSSGINQQYNRIYLNVHVRDEDGTPHVLYLSEELI